jgi:Flp pilus assembly protein TadD
MTAGCGFSESQNITWTGGPSTVEQASPVPANAYTYPASYGVYLLNGSVFSRIISKLVPTNPSGDLSLLVFEKWVADPKADISAIVIDDLRHVGETPMPHVSVVTRRVENHPDMVMVVPNQPLDAGLYSVSVKAGVDVPEYGFGVETPDPVAFWKSVVQDHPTIWQAHNHLGATLYMDGDVKDAYPQFLKATQLNPQNPESHNNLGLALGYLGKTDEAIKQFELAVKIKDDPAIETNLANAYEQVKRYDDAIRTYRHAIQLNPNNTTAHCNLGFVLMQEGKVDDAIREFEKTLKLDPNMPPAQTGLQQALGLKANKQ